MHKKRFDDVFRAMADLFKILAHSDRLRLIGLISEKEMDVMHLCSALGISQSSVSQHLKLLKMHSLVKEKRVGKRVFYKLASNPLKRIIVDAIEVHTRDLDNDVKSASLFKEMKAFWL